LVSTKKIPAQRSVPPGGWPMYSLRQIWLQALTLSRSFSCVAGPVAEHSHKHPW